MVSQNSKVENSFINYFDKETEIYKGMKKIDQNLGGTNSIGYYFKFPQKQKEQKDDEFSEWEEDVQEDDKVKILVYER